MESVGALLPQIADFVGDSGTCADSPKVLAALNDVRLLLWSKGDFENTTEYVCYCCPECCVTLASRHAQVRQVWLNKRPLDLRGEWYQAATGLVDCCGTYCGDQRSIQEVGGYHVTFWDFGCPFYLRIAGEDIADQGTVLSFEVIDTSGKRSTINMTVGEPYQKVEVQTMLSTLARVTKPKTKNRVRVYAFNPYTGTEQLIALYEGSDINPSFKKYIMPRSCASAKQVILLTKLKYFPLTSNNELVEFNLNTLIPGLLAINARKNRNQTDMLSNLQIAVLEANRAMADNEVEGATIMKIQNPKNIYNLIPGC